MGVVGLAENKANSAPIELELELELSLATMIKVLVTNQLLFYIHVNFYANMKYTQQF